MLFGLMGRPDLAGDRHPELAPAGVRVVPADMLLAECDVVSLHLPLTPATRGLIDAGRLARMKPSPRSPPPCCPMTR